MSISEETIRPVERLVVDRYTDIIGPSVEMLGPVCDGGEIEFLTVPGCWGPMITPSLRSGHEVSLPVAVEGASVGDAIAITVQELDQRSEAASSGTGIPEDGRFISDPFIAAICPVCRDAGNDFKYPETDIVGTGEDAIRCRSCGSPVSPFRMGQGYTMVFDSNYELGLTVSPPAALEIAADARRWQGLTEFSRQHPIVALAKADLVGVVSRCRISMGNLGSTPAIDLPSSHNCGDFGVSLLGADHEFAVTPEQLRERTDAHMDIDSVRPGSTLLVPVKVAGGGIYAGDAHAMIGDGEVAGHAVDISARLLVRVRVLKGVQLEGPVLLPLVEDLPFLAKPLSERERAMAEALASQYRTRVEGDSWPLQVLGTGAFLNEAVENAIGRSVKLLRLSSDEVRNRVTITGACEIGRLPGVVHVSLQVPADVLEDVGLLSTIQGQYRIEQ